MYRVTVGDLIRLIQYTNTKGDRNFPIRVAGGEPDPEGAPAGGTGSEEEGRPMPVRSLSTRARDFANRPNVREVGAERMSETSSLQFPISRKVSSGEAGRVRGMHVVNHIEHLGHEDANKNASFIVDTTSNEQRGAIMVMRVGEAGHFSEHREI